MLSAVSIPMTVLGGLQPTKLARVKRMISRFNTDDGIRRATTRSTTSSLLPHLRFNTDDGIRRATTRGLVNVEVKDAAVSIPMTVLGGLQLLLRFSEC